MRLLLKMSKNLCKGELPRPVLLIFYHLVTTFTTFTFTLPGFVLRSPSIYYLKCNKLCPIRLSQPQVKHEQNFFTKANRIQQNHNNSVPNTAMHDIQFNAMQY